MVFNELHELDLVTDTFLKRALRQPITLQRGAPSLVRGTLRMVFAELGNAGRDQLGGSGLRWPNLFPQQLLIDQAIEGCVGLGRGERVRITGIRKSLDGHFLFPIALQNHVAVNAGDYTIDNLTTYR
jgi:hypothetical protein